MDPTAFLLSGANAVVVVGNQHVVLSHHRLSRPRAVNGQQKALAQAPEHGHFGSCFFAFLRSCFSAIFCLPTSLYLIRVNLILAGNLDNGQFPSHCLKRYTALDAVVSFAHKTAGSVLAARIVCIF